MALTIMTIVLFTFIASPGLAIPIPEPSLQPLVLGSAEPSIEPGLEPSPEMTSDPVLVSPIPSPGAACFPARALVYLEDGRQVTMKDIRLGDRVRVAPGVFSPVILFTHADASASTKMVVITGTRGRVAASPGHFIKVNGNLRRAEEIVAGDTIEVFNGTERQEDIVQNVEVQILEGLFNPQTVAGQILVAADDSSSPVLASTYTDAVDPAMARALESPLRALHAAASATRRFDGTFLDMARAPTGLSNRALAALVFTFASVAAAQCKGALPVRS